MPADDHVELVDTAATPGSDARFGLVNADQGLSLRLATDATALPVTAVWRAFRSGVYALGIEPQSADDTSPLAPGERRDYRLDLIAGD